MPYQLSVARAREWLSGWPHGTGFAVCHSGEVDGIASAALVLRFLERSGHVRPAIFTPNKGGMSQDGAMWARAGKSSANAIIILDMAPSVVSFVPEGTGILYVADNVTAVAPLPGYLEKEFRADSVAPTTSLTTYRIVEPLLDLSDVAWYAPLGVIAERGPTASFPEHTSAKKRWGQKNLVETVALLSAGKLAAAHDIGSALAALLHAETPADIANGMIDEYDILDDYRSELHRERVRCAKISPLIADEWALVRFSSSCQIEGALSASWVGRLPKHVVIAANDGYLPGQVCFSARTRKLGIDLLNLLQSIDGLQIDSTGENQLPGAVRGVAAAGSFNQFLSTIGIAQGGKRPSRESV